MSVAPHAVKPSAPFVSHAPSTSPAATVAITVETERRTFIMWMA
jgi:hypothetical protein